MARATASFSREFRKFMRRNDPVKCSGAGSTPARRVLRAPAGLDEEEFAMKGDVVRDAQAPIEIDQVDAAAQQDVLAVVDGFTMPAS